LVVAVDRTFHGGDAGIGNIRAAGDVLFVPQEEIELMLLADGGQDAAVEVVWITCVPAGNGIVLQLGYLLNKLARVGQHEWAFYGKARGRAKCGGGMIETPRKCGKTSSQAHS